MEKDYIAELKKAVENTNLRINFEKLDADKNLSEQGIDSFDFLMLLYAVEEYFHVDISDHIDTEDFNTLNKIFSVIKKSQQN